MGINWQAFCQDTLAACRERREQEAQEEARRQAEIDQRQAEYEYPYYRITLDSAGYIRENDDGSFGWHWYGYPADDIQWNWDKPNVVSHKGQWYIAAGFARMIGSGHPADYAQGYVRVGRRKYWPISARWIQQSWRAQQYRRRNRRELQVQRRNLEVLVWLAGLVGVDHAAEPTGYVREIEIHLVEA